MKKKLVYILLLILLGGFGFAQETSTMNKPQQELYKIGFGIPKSTMVAPDFTTKDTHGNNVSLHSLKGNVVLLNLWATWCPPCQREMPSIERLYKKMKGKKFSILAVATPTPPRETKEKILSFIKKNNYTFPVMIDTKGTVYGIYGSGSIPTTWIIAPDGTVVGRLVGGREWDTDEMVTIFNSLLK